MTERKKDLLFLGALLALLILVFAKILFTAKIIRAPDITNEYYWHVLDVAKQKIWDCFRINLASAGWDMFTNSGSSVGGGTNSLQFLGFRDVIYHLIPPPTSVAWFIVMHLWFGAAGTYLYCRLIGASRLAALLGGLIFAVAPENASLINAGHVMKIATISFAPWAFYFLEKGFQTRRLIWFLATGFFLAFQFFNIHWQIAYYTCLCVGAYGVLRLAAIARRPAEGEKGSLPRLLGMNGLLLVFFLTTVSISLLPLADWSRETNRGVQSGSNQGGAGGLKGGLNVEEAMAWSMPPEEAATFVIPGFFGLSRQEGGENPKNIASYYWGRMHFTQTTDYMGLLPWLLLPLPLIFRRDRYTWLAVAGIAGGILFSFGQYTPFYWALYKFFPGINHFRVPKMMMFIPVMGLAVMAARGLDLLRDEEVRGSRAFRRYLLGCAALPLLLLVLAGIEIAGANHWLERFAGILAQPTRYEQGMYLVAQRWGNLVRETLIAAGIAALYAAAFFLAKNRRAARAVPWLLLLLFVGDTWRINDKFLFTVPAPARAREGASTPPLVQFLEKMPSEYRVLPLDGSDPMQYVSRRIPVVFTPNAVQQMRWQQFLESFNLVCPMPDLLNVKYLIMGGQEYAQQKGQLGDRYAPVFTTPGGGSVVMENRSVLPKGWLVPAAAVVTDPAQRLALLQNPRFNPARVALVESPPPIPLADPNSPPAPFPARDVTVPVYQGEHIVVDAAPPADALLVLGEKYYQGWKATVDGKATEIVAVDHILRGVYLTPGKHRVEFRFDPLPFRIGKYLTLGSFALFAAVLVREWLVMRRRMKDEG
ncbi:MAG TPA: YfhO family protein [Desulfuromonadaceae bacterium]